jgi:hypothetical protein
VIARPPTRGNHTNGYIAAAVSRAFFDQIDDELRGLLGPALRHYESVRASRLIKLWYRDPNVHFEVQMVARRWSPTREPVLEVGLHLEDPDPTVNERRLSGLTSGRASWRKKLPDPGIGPALGPRGGAWRRVSEFLEEAGGDDPDLASEAAERLALYVRTLWPLLEGSSMKPHGDAGPG